MIGGIINRGTDLLASEVAPVLNVSYGERVGGLWVRHLEIGV